MAAPAKKPVAAKVKKAFHIHTLYEVKGDKLERKTRFCPKCGPGVFLGKHKDRKTCGRCGYSERISATKAE